MRHVLLLLAAIACGGDDAPDDGPSSSPQYPITTSATGHTGTPGPTSEYDDLELWVCHPDKPSDGCREDLDVTAVAADGSTTLVPHVVATDPPVDCFYVYPTVSTDPAANSDRIDDGPEGFMTQAQAGFYSSVCNVYAPMYRQITITGLLDPDGDPELAYGDVLEAFEATIARSDRPFFVIGHSQGTRHSIRLIAERIETDPDVASRMVSAHLFGGEVFVPDGATTGGSFQSVPPCTTPTDTGCVIHHVTYQDDKPPDSGAIFGRTYGGPVLCTNPAGLDGGATPLRGRFPVNTPSTVAAVVGNELGPYQDRARSAEIPTKFYSVPGLFEGQCTTDGTFAWLEVTVNSDPDDPRVDDIQGDLILPGWGLHLVDMAVVSEDLVDLAAQQAAAFVP